MPTRHRTPGVQTIPGHPGPTNARPRRPRQPACAPRPPLPAGAVLVPRSPCTSSTMDGRTPPMPPAALPPIEHTPRPSGPTPCPALWTLITHATCSITHLSHHRTITAAHFCPGRHARAQPRPPWTKPTVHRTRVYLRAPGASLLTRTTSTPPQSPPGRTTTALTLYFPSSVQSSASSALPSPCRYRPHPASPFPSLDSRPP